MKKLVSFALAIGVVSCVTVSQPMGEFSESIFLLFAPSVPVA